MYRYLKDSSDPAVELTGVAKTATFTSESIDLDVLGDVVGLCYKLTSSSGTSPTLDITAEMSPDGTTWFDLPGTDNDPTQAASAQNTGDTTSPHPTEYWGVPAERGDANAAVRFTFTIGGTNPSFTIEAWVFDKVFNSR